MRPVITRAEALALLCSLPDMEAEVYENSNLRFLTEHYQSCIQSYSCADLLRMIKSIYTKRCVLSERGKKMGLVDERYMKRAEEMLHGELAVALGIERSMVPAFIEQSMEKLSRGEKLA